MKPSVWKTKRLENQAWKPSRNRVKVFPPVEDGTARTEKLLEGDANTRRMQLFSSLFSHFESHFSLLTIRIRGMYT